MIVVKSIQKPIWNILPSTLFLRIYSQIPILSLQQYVYEKKHSCNIQAGLSLRIFSFIEIMYQRCLLILRLSESAFDSVCYSVTCQYIPSALMMFPNLGNEMSCKKITKLSSTLSYKYSSVSVFVLSRKLQNSSRKMFFLLYGLPTYFLFIILSCVTSSHTDSLLLIMAGLI